MMVLRSSGNLVNPAVPLLLAPAGGMALGGLLGLAIDASPGRVLRLTALPLGVGTLLMLSGLLLTNDYGLSAVTATLGIVTMFGITLLFTSPDPESAPALVPTAPTASPSSVRWAPVPLILPARVRNEGVAIGPGVALVF